MTAPPQTEEQNKWKVPYLAGVICGTAMVSPVMKDLTNDERHQLLKCAIEFAARKLGLLT